MYCVTNHPVIQLSSLYEVCMQFSCLTMHFPLQVICVPHLMLISFKCYSEINLYNFYFYFIVLSSPMVSASAISTTTISLFWTSAGTVIDSYEVMWDTDDIGGCSGGSDMDNTTISASSTSYVVIELEEDSSYTINGEATIIAITLEAGEK